MAYGVWRWEEGYGLRAAGCGPRPARLCVRKRGTEPVAIKKCCVGALRGYLRGLVLLSRPPLQRHTHAAPPHRTELHAARTLSAAVLLWRAICINTLPTPFSVYRERVWRGLVSHHAGPAAGTSRHTCRGGVPVNNAVRGLRNGACVPVLRVPGHSSCSRPCSSQTRFPSPAFRAAHTHTHTHTHTNSFRKMLPWCKRRECDTYTWHNTV